MGKSSRKLLYIKWLDAAGPQNDRWEVCTDIDEFIEEDFIIEDVGFLL